jgi:hypothetical protein
MAYYLLQLTVGEGELDKRECTIAKLFLQIDNGFYQRLRSRLEPFQDENRAERAQWDAPDDRR